MWTATFTFTILSGLVATVAKIVGEFSKLKTTLEMYMDAQNKLNVSVPIFEKRLTDLENRVIDHTTNIAKESARNETQNEFLSKLDGRMNEIVHSIDNMASKMDDMTKGLK